MEVEAVVHLVVVRQVLEEVLVIGIQVMELVLQEHNLPLVEQLVRLLHHQLAVVVQVVEDETVMEMVPQELELVVVAQERVELPVELRQVV
jgi:hypothetical protein